MSPDIQILPPELQNQIAAGEVVERPSSVLKELVENSLDAGASRIQAGIEGGGQTLIQVEDNGVGMSPDQLPAALTRHATSKITSFQDLLRIASFGFRGEALPSIGSVSRMEIRSIAQGQSEGATVQVEFGVISEVKPTPCREGTCIQVRDLFVNTPARLKFLKKQTTEAKRCQEVMHRFALARPDVGFSLTSGGREVCTFSPGQSLLQRLQTIWPQSITAKLLPVQAEDEAYALSGYIGHPEVAQGRADRILFFVNQRPVQDKMLLSALRQAFKGRLLSKEYPQAALFLQIPSQEVDVNVHPAKLEVRFRDEQRLFSLLHRGLTRALSQDLEPEPESERSDSESRSSSARYQPRYKFQTFEAFQAPASNEDGTDWKVETTSSQPSEPAFDPDQPSPPLQSFEISSGRVGAYTYLGQIQASYLLLTSTHNELILVDQHAAHERILFHRFTHHSQQSVSRPLAVPIHRALHPSEQEHLNQVAPRLRHMGFSLDRPQAETVLIRAVPVHLDPAQAGNLLEQILSQQVDSQDDLWQMMACRQAIKAGDTLSPQEALELIQIWLKTPDRNYCPHGRPAAITLSGSELEAMFKRRG